MFVPRYTMIAVAAVALLAQSCSAGRPPLLAGESQAGGRALLLAPEIGLGSGVDAEASRRLSARLEAELRDALGSRQVSLEGPWSGRDADAARRQLLERMRRSEGERMRAGAAIPLDDALVPLRETGASSLLAVRLLRRPTMGEGGFVPRPHGELVELPDDRPDYQIPSAEEFATGGVELELLLVDAGTSRVLTHRRVAHPVTGDDVAAVLAPLVRLATRGISASGR